MRLGRTDQVAFAGAFVTSVHTCCSAISRDFPVVGDHVSVSETNEQTS